MPRPPGTGTLVEQFTTLRRQLAELTRRASATFVCDVYPSATFALSGGTETFAGSGAGSWIARQDPDGMFTPGTRHALTIPASGRWVVASHATFNPSNNTPYVITQIYRNGIASADRIAADAGNIVVNTQSICLHATRELVLAQGDVLHWTHYASATASVSGGLDGLYTSMYARYIGAD